jgi:monofunctional chorismate mutase
MPSDTINKLRSKIDELDDQIFSLIVKRLKQTQQIGKIKEEAELPIGDSSRENNIINRLHGELEKDLSREQIKKILEPIILISKDLQRERK